MGITEEVPCLLGVHLGAGDLTSGLDGLMLCGTISEAPTFRIPVQVAAAFVIQE